MPQRMRMAAAVVALLVLVVGCTKTSDEVDTGARSEALEHARTACDLTGKAGEAAEVDTPERYAAAAFLMDNAIIESERAALGAAEFTALDRAVQAVHAAAHRGDREEWKKALETALDACSD